MDRNILSEYSDPALVYNHLCYHNICEEAFYPQVHDVFEMIFLKKGDITYLIEEKKFRVKQNSLIIAPPGKIHSMQFHNLGIYDRYDVLFEEKALYPSVIGQIPDDTYVINLNEYPTILDLFDKMDFYCIHFSGDDLKNIITNLIEEIIYNIIYITRHFPDSCSNGSYTANPVIAEAVEYIDDHLNTHFTLDMLCRDLSISKSYLHKLFEKHMQISPQRYITVKKLTAVQKAIHAGGRPVDVYSDFGFQDYSSFFRAFKKHFGYSPSQEANRITVRKIEF